MKLTETVFSVPNHVCATFDTGGIFLFCIVYVHVVVGGFSKRRRGYENATVNNPIVSRTTLEQGTVNETFKYIGRIASRHADINDSEQMSLVLLRETTSTSKI